MLYNSVALGGAVIHVAISLISPALPGRVVGEVEHEAHMSVEEGCVIQAVIALPGFHLMNGIGLDICVFMLQNMYQREKKEIVGSHPHPQNDLLVLGQPANHLYSMAGPSIEV